MPEVDPIIHQPSRLKIMAALAGLAGGARVDFNFLLDLLKLSEGNLSVHLQKLEKAKLILIVKEFVKRYPKTWVRITNHGRAAFSEYVSSLESIISLKNTGKSGTLKRKNGKEKV